MIRMHSLVRQSLTRVTIRSSCTLLRRPPLTPPFPYTTLFRSPPSGASDRFPLRQPLRDECGAFLIVATVQDAQVATIKNRSEEHTSELQSLRHLVCRLLLEKKKYISSASQHYILGLTRLTDRS